MGAGSTALTFSGNNLKGARHPFNIGVGVDSCFDRPNPPHYREGREGEILYTLFRVRGIWHFDTAPLLF